MLIAAIAHGYAFPVADYVPPPGTERPKFGDNVKHMLSCGDAVGDLVAIFGCAGPTETEEGGSGGDVEMGDAPAGGAPAGGAPAAQLADAAAAAEAEKADAERKERHRKRKAEKAARAAAKAEAAANAARAEAPPAETPAAQPAAPPAARSVVAAGIPPSRAGTNMSVMSSSSIPVGAQPAPLIEQWADVATEKLSSVFGAIGLGPLPCAPERSQTVTSVAAEPAPPSPPPPRVVETPSRVRTSRSAAPPER